MSKKRHSSAKKKKKSSDSAYRWKRFGNVEYLEDALGCVVEIKASNGVFKIKSNPFLDIGNSRRDA